MEGEAIKLGDTLVHALSRCMPLRLGCVLLGPLLFFGLRWILHDDQVKREYQTDKSCPELGLGQRNLRKMVEGKTSKNERKQGVYLLEHGVG
jgi:hypothetical protein